MDQLCDYYLRKSAKSVDKYLKDDPQISQIRTDLFHHVHYLMVLFLSNDVRITITIQLLHYQHFSNVAAHARSPMLP